MQPLKRMVDFLLSKLHIIKHTYIQDEAYF